MTLSPAWIDELRARTTLSAIIAPTVKLTKAGREFKACCPFHNEKTPSFYVNDEKGFYHCFGCSAHGDAIRFLTDARGMPFMDAVKELAGKAGMDVPAPDPRAQERQERASGLYDVMASAQRWFVEQLQGIEGAEARAYLKQRGISAATQKKFGFGFAPDSRGKLKAALSDIGNEKLVEAGLLIQPDEGKEPYDRFRGRLTYPIRDVRGRVIAFSARILGAGEPKYLNSPDTPLFDKGRTLFNIDFAGPASRNAKRILIVEGQMDVIALDQAGISEAVAPLGTALTEDQLQRLWRLEPVPICCFDGDAAGQKAAIRAAKRALPFLGDGRTLEFAFLPFGSDPDDVIRTEGREGFERIVAARRPLSKVLYTSAKASVDVQTPEGRAGLRASLLALADTIQHGIVRSEYRRDFNDKFFEEFGWKRSERKIIGTSVLRTGPDGPPELYSSFFRSALYGLARFPVILQSLAETVAYLKLENDELKKWRHALLDGTVRHHGLEDDALEAILAASNLKPKTRVNIQSDLRFRWDVDPSDAVRSLGGMIMFLHDEQDLVAEIEAVQKRISDDLGYDQYLALDQRRSELYALKRELYESAYRLSRYENELDD
nr:DNA primase [uncultured Sphingomonas sp.]